MAKINILEKSVAEKIAAGEVVERPGSVVKELIENSFDAMATSVTIEIEKGGVGYIRVTDNGTGIAKEDVATAFLRHATSKIKDEKDLESIRTLGFRGEALCSISAVSRTEVITRTAQEDIGTFMVVEGGETKQYNQAGCPLGTTVTVRNLFFNTPARHKFLKKDSVEAAFVTDICQRAALSHPEVSVRYIRDGKDIFFTPGDNQLKNTIRAVFGKDISNAMTDVDYSDGMYSVKGLTGANNLSRPNRNMQYFFVNGRLVKSALLSVALSEAYKNELMIGKFPVCALNITLPWEMVDVNVHPAKTEVKFVNEEEVYRAVVFAAKNALVKNTQPKQSFRESKQAFKLSVETPRVTQEVFKTAVKPVYEPVKKEEKPKTSFTKVERVKMVSNAFELPQKKIETLCVSEKFEEAVKKESMVQPEAVIKRDVVVPDGAKEEKKEEAREVIIPDFLVIGQLFSTYIILQMDNEMVMVDQHAAHERINYERIKNSGCMKQVALMPKTVSLTPREMAVWEENKEFFNSMGFEVDEFGQDSVIIRAMPSDIDYEDSDGLLMEIIESLSGNDKGEISYLRDKAVYTIACKAAIKANKKLSVEEMEKLCKDVFMAEGVSTCPHGRPIMVKMTKYQIEKMFKRIV